MLIRNCSFLGIQIRIIMKRIFCVVALLLLAGAMWGQEPATEPKSKVGSLIAKTGSMTQVEYLSFDAIGTIGVAPLVLTDLRSGEMRGSLSFRVSVANYANPTHPIVHYTYLDYEEIDSCIKVLQYAKAKLLRVKPRYFMKAMYHAAQGTEVGVFWGGGLFGPKWKIYVKPWNTTLDRAATVSADEFDRFIGVLETSKSLLMNRMELDTAKTSASPAQQ